MKKLFVIVLAAIGMVSCMNTDEVIEVKGGDAIAFADVMLDNAVRAAVDPSTTFETIQGFNVWGFMDDVNGVVFEGDEVTRSGDTWTYSPTQYWAPSHTYYFAALSPIGGQWTLNTANGGTLGAGIVNFVNNDGSEDLLYAKAIVTTEADINKQPGAVKLQFQHLLSKVKFTFKSEFPSERQTIKVKDIKMTAAKAASIDLAVADYTKGWVLTDAQETYSFGDLENTLTISDINGWESAQERLLIPAAADYVYTITFTVELYNGQNLAQTFNETTELTGKALEMGTAYNFVATLSPDNLGLYPIQFTVGVDSWVEDEVVVDPRVNYVSTLAELQAAVDAATATEGYNIILTNDIEGVVTVTQKTGVNIVIDGANHTYTGTIEVDGKSNANEKTLTVKNLNFKALATTVNFINCSDDVVAVRNAKRYARVIVDGCTFEGPGATSDVVAVRLYQPFGVTIKNSTATGLHSLAQITSATNEVVIEKVTVTDCAKGINISNSGDEVVISECQINGVEAGEYGVRIDNTKNALIEKSTIKAAQPIVLRKNAVGNTNVVNINDTVLAGDGEAIIVEDAAAPAIYINGALYGGGYFVVNNAAELTAALAANEKFILLAADCEGNFKMQSNTTIVAMSGVKVGSIDLNGADNVTLKGITFDAANAVLAVDGKGNAKQYASVYSAGSKVAKGSNNVVIDGCTFVGTLVNGGVAICFTDQSRGSGQSGNITVKNCVFEQDGAYYTIYAYYSGKGYMNIEGNTFKGLVHPQGYHIYLGRYQSGTPVVVEGNTFEEYSAFTEAAYIQDHGNYGVSFAAANNTFGK